MQRHATVIKAYLSVRQSDSKATWLPKIWPNIKAQMEIILTKFDDGTRVIRVAQVTLAPLVKCAPKRRSTLVRALMPRHCACTATTATACDACHCCDACRKF